MKLFDKLKKLGGEIVDQFTPEDNKQLKKWKSKLETAIASTSYNSTIIDEREQIYLGTRFVDGNVNSNKRPNKKANNIYNIAFEMIESQVNSVIPQPSVRSKRPDYEEQAKMIEDSIANDLKEIGIEEINDINERITPVQGFSILTVDWDPDFKHHLYRGEIKVSYKHPKQLIPQPGIFHIQKMDYFFILSSVTKEYIKRRYGVDDLDSDTEQYPNVTSLLDSAQSNTENEKVTEIVCWYKDKDNDICKFVWTNDTVLEDYPKFFYRRIDGQIQQNETIDQDIQLLDGSVIPQGTEVPYFMPTRYPVVIRKNVPKSFAFEGQSDIDILRDQQDSIKKVGTKMEEKIMKGGQLVLLPDSVRDQITNETYQILRVTAQEMAAIQTKDLTAPIDEDLNYIQQQREVIQWMLGVTNAFQGQVDSSAQSGVAKQIQVQQASGRMRSKEFNKQTAFKDLFEILFEFKLAFYDELRPYLSKDSKGNVSYGDFDKYQFLMQDASGEYFYNTDFIFDADTGQGIPKDPMFLFNQAINMYAQQAIDKVQFWTIMESINFPMAKEIKDQAEQEQQMQQQQQMQDQPPDINQIVSQLPPQEQQAFQQADPQQQQAIIQQFMGQQQPGQQQNVQQAQPNQPHPFDQLLAQLPKHEQDMFKKMDPQQQKVITDQMMAALQQQQQNPMMGGQPNG
jgi:hypothetical protein